ncbi:MAG TPA: class I SAM-dependent methyltransferase [Acidimicrobiales bacterium]|nr:class I SAM-dependent methyltransferase [Acidimicrobiales bacterium]
MTRSDRSSDGSPSRQRRRSRVGHWTWGVATVGILANGLRMRARLSQFAVLDDFLAGTGPHDLAGLADLTDPDGTPLPLPLGINGTGAEALRYLVVPETDLDDFVMVVADGVTVDDLTLRAVVRYARFHHLDVVDLIPGDLAVGELLELARLVNPKTYRSDRLHGGRTAGHATLVRTALAERLGLERTSGLDPVEHVELITQLKRFAPTTTDLAIAPRLEARPPELAWRLPRQKAMYGGASGAFTAGPAVAGALATLGPKLGRSLGTTTLLAYAAQPYIATAGVPLRPRDLGLLSALTRAPRQVTGTARALMITPPSVVTDRVEAVARVDEQRRHDYALQLDDTEALFEPPRTTCPWCGTDELRRVVTVPDMLQRKPGEFHLDECTDCGHVFQNPRLSPEGLEFYYRDFYDGLGDDDAEFVFSMGAHSYRGRAEMLRGVAEPKRWLDVGAGHGHFCLVAKELWPDTCFDGLDQSDSVAEAQRRGWLDHGYQGVFPDLAANLVGAYDVVSMHHYLEHTRDPEAELDAATIALESGGHLLIEVPDPDSRLGRKLGWMWGPWFQPQHQHFVSLDNLTEALRSRGFSVVGSERGEAHQPVDLAFAMWLVAHRVAPAGDEPWHPRMTPARRMGRAATLTAFFPLLATAFAADQLMAPVLRRMPQMTNTYRVLARKE